MIFAKKKFHLIFSCVYSYKWTVCPFANVTQAETSTRWNPFKAIIGIWYEWEIGEQQRFSTMLFANGDDCGQNGNRQTRLKFKCNKSNDKTEIVSTREPKTCSYEIQMQTPLVCSDKILADDAHVSGQDMMNVYPYLNGTHRNEWDSLFTQLEQKMITPKMYEFSLNELLIKAGFRRSDEEKRALEIVKVEKTGEMEEGEDDEAKRSGQLGQLSKKELIDRLESCQRENDLLKGQYKLINKVYENHFSSSTTQPK